MTYKHNTWNLEWRVAPNVLQKKEKYLFKASVIEILVNSWLFYVRRMLELRTSQCDVYKSDKYTEEQTI